MNTYHKYCANVFLAKCAERHEKGETIDVSTKYGKENESIVFNLIFEKDGFFYYSIVRADGFNVQEWAKRKAERCAESANKNDAKSNEFFRKSEKDRDFLALGEPIKVGHHSESRHRKAVDQAWHNTGKAVEFSDKADEQANKAEHWEKKSTVINLSLPESIEYYERILFKAKEYHDGLKTGKYPKAHSYSMPYANKAVKEAQRNYDTAVQLWG